MDLLPPLGEDGIFEQQDEAPPNVLGPPIADPLRRVADALREEEDNAPLVAAACEGQGASGDSD